MRVRFRILSVTLRQSDLQTHSAVKPHLVPHTALAQRTDFQSVVESMRSDKAGASRGGQAFIIFKSDSAVTVLRRTRNVCARVVCEATSLRCRSQRASCCRQTFKKSADLAALSAKPATAGRVDQDESRAGAPLILCSAARHAALPLPDAGCARPACKQAVSGRLPTVGIRCGQDGKFGKKTSPKQHS